MPCFWEFPFALMLVAIFPCGSGQDDVSTIFGLVHNLATLGNTELNYRLIQLTSDLRCAIFVLKLQPSKVCSTEQMDQNLFSCD